MVRGQCPGCKFELTSVNGENVQCPNCDRVVSAEELKASQASAVYGGAEGQASQFAMQIENPTAGLAYLENRFETMDWEEFETNLFFDMEDISTVIEKNKVTNANNPDTWLLEFKSITEIIQHKFNGLKKLIGEIEELYTPLDLTNTFEAFDKYVKLTHALIERKDKFFKELQSDIRFLTKFKATPDVIKSAENGLKNLEEQYNALVEVKNVEEIPEIAKLIAKMQKKIAQSLAEEGIDAESLYNEAVSDYNDASRSSSALEKFQQLKGYKDSSKYIAKINSLSVFNDLVEVNGALYFADTTKKTTTFSVSNALANAKQANIKASGCSGKAAPNQPAASTPQEPTYEGKMTSLFPIIDKKVTAKDPIVNSISSLLTTYNGKIFFISNGKEIHSFNFHTREEKTLDVGKLGSYTQLSKTDKRMFIWNGDRTAIFLKKRLETRPVAMENKGCFGGKNQPVKEQLNNFSLLKIDLVTGTAKTVLPEMVDVMDVFGDYIFYTQSRMITITEGTKKGSKTKTEPKVFFAAYNRNTGVSEDVLSEDDYLVDSVGSKVVYCKYSPTLFNMDLYVYDMIEKTSLLLENNIYDADLIHDGKVLYTVGSADRRSLFSIELDGTNRTEIMLNVERIAFYDEYWMYVIKGYGYNRTLIKISYDGKKRVIVAMGIDSIVEWNSGYVYFVDTFGSLCVVRNDGLQREEIIDNCKQAKIIVDTDQIFILRKEKMDVKGRVQQYSLYQVDLQGHNIKKVYYGLCDMAEIDDKRIFFKQVETRKFKITTPQQKGEPVISYKTADITTYYSYDRQTREIISLFVKGIPETTTVDIKKGCLGKTVPTPITIEEIVEKNAYTREGKMTPGEVAKEDKKEAEQSAQTTPLSTAQSASSLGKIANPLGSGCSGCSGAKK